ncbi:MAG: phosphoribosylamine--glycine ligase [Chitinophagales bacterium]
MNIAILGSGGREHALEWKFSQSIGVENVFVLPGNGGTYNNMPIDLQNFAVIEAFCKTENIGLIFVGPEAPLVGGIVDYFQNQNSPIKVFGPSQKAAMLEGSKIWSKQFMQKYGVATADFWVFESTEAARQKIEELGGDLVIKYDGLAGGKGVYVCDNVEEALQSLEELQASYGEDAEFLIETKLIGQEISIIGFTDGKTTKLLHPSQDHKQLLDGDKGPNTGGMGAFCPVSWCDAPMLQDIINAVVLPTINGIQAEDLDYKGVIYYGLMMTSEGPKLLEYNARFGDPETEVLLPSMKSDLLQLVMACFDGSLADFPLELADDYFVDVVMTAGGYPKKYEKGNEITGLEDISSEALVFHAGTSNGENGEILTNGGRVLNIIARGESLEEAIEAAYIEVKKVHFKDAYYRTDIGKRPIV